MEVIEQKIGAFMNTPVVISITTALVFGCFLLVIFSKTSLGKKLFNQMQKKFNEFLFLQGEIKKEAEKTRQLAETKINELKEEYEKKLGVALSYSNELENLLYEIGDVIPNAKVKSVVEKFKEQKEARLKEISKVVGTYEQFVELTHKGDEIEQEIETRVKEQVNDYQELFNNKEKELEAIIEEYKKKLEVLANEEAKDTNPTQEEI